MLGQRIELLEVEHVMRTWAGVRDVIVALVPGAAGRASLGAVFTGVERRSTDIRTALLPRLPLAMIPQHYLRVDQLPVNDRGKIDRAARASLLAVQDG